ncbi:MAG: hypothetical protein M3P06_11320 [Acidobacteriota bacterium]|nr:hypothetical protein [Acidobacteriota bacterium]
MTQPTEDRSELYLRFSRRGMTLLLIVIVALGAVALAMALRPDSAIAQALEKAPWFFPIATIIGVAAVQTSLRKNRWDPKSPEVQAIMNDEWRRTNLDRAMKIAFIVILVVQLPLGWLFGVMFAQLSVLRAVLGMAVSTITLGMTTFVATFLILDRD